MTSEITNITLKEKKLDDLRKLRELKHKKRLSQCRKDYSAFAEYVLRDESTNAQIKMADIHKVWVQHINESFTLGLHPVICAPFGHGKTSHLGLGVPLFAVGHDTSLRTVILSANQDLAGERAQSIASYIANSDEYHEVFPHVLPDYERGWTQKKLFIKRVTQAKDPTFVAAGIGGEITGRRTDMFICDDVNNAKNTLHQPREREKIWNIFTGTVVPRLEPGGKILIIATRWHEKDLVGYIMAERTMNKKYAFLIQRISEDFSKIDCEVLINKDIDKFSKHRSELHNLFMLSEGGLI